MDTTWSRQFDNGLGMEMSEFKKLQDAQQTSLSPQTGWLNTAMGQSPLANGADPTWSQSIFGYKGADGKSVDGLGGSILGLAKTGMNAWLGMEQLDLAKDSLDFQKNAFSKQFENQRKLTNADLSWRQQGRKSAGYSDMSVDDYMKKYGV